MRYLIIAVLLGCSGTNGSAPDASPDGSSCSGAPQVSFKTDVVRLIGHCGGEVCHGGVGASWPYAALVNKPTTQCEDGRLLVKPGDPTNSYLMQKLEGTHMCLGTQMPRGSGQLAAADLATIRAWICNGAPNN